MQLSLFSTIDIPGATTTLSRPLGLARGTDVPVRVLVDNIGPLTVFLSGDSNDLVGPEGPTSKTFQLFPGNSRTFVLAPSQTIYAAGATDGARVSVHVSEALPLV